jgi:two-component system sensor histidine kinase AlgZ
VDNRRAADSIDRAMRATMTTSSLSSSFDSAITPSPAAGGTRAFDLCHPALALRAVLLVQGAVAVAALAAAVGWADAVALLGAGLFAGLVGTLLWLGAVCALQRRLARRTPGARAVLLTLLGAGVAIAGWLPLAWIGIVASSGPRLVAVPLAGAALAALAAAWLEARARAQRPADATARLAELQARIRPHFLFNALNTALALVRVDPARAEGVLEDLAELFRGVLADDREAVSLEQEIELARKYLAIEQIRFGERLVLEWEIDPAAAGARVPPLVLQPLVENAVRHGIEPAPAGGTIRIRTQVRLGQAVIRIDNTVPPLPSQPGHGMALANVRERLRLMHDVAAQLDAKREAQRFRVQIVVPL